MHTFGTLMVNSNRLSLCQNKEKVKQEEKDELATIQS